MKKILVFGAAGLVGSRFVWLNKGNFELICPTIEELDILQLEAINQKMDQFRPDTVINFAAYTNVDEAQKEVNQKEGIVYKLNVTAASNVAKICKEKNTHLIHISTSFVFDGTKENAPYEENDQTNPLSWYAKTKLLGEEAVLDILMDACIARIDMPYRSSFTDKKDFARFFVENFKENLPVKVVFDQKITPIFIDSLSSALSELVNLEAHGIYHIAPTDYTSPIEFVRALAKVLGFKESLILETSFAEFNKDREVKRPQNSWMDSSKVRKLIGEEILQSVKEDITEFCQQIS